MRAWAALLAAASLAAAACGGDSKEGSEASGPAREITTLARQGEKTAYRASYSYSISGPSPVANAAQTKIDVVQRPPDVLRKIETTMEATPGRPVTVASWSIRKGDASYSCSTYGKEVTCLPSPAPSGRYGYQQLDEIAELVTSADKAFKSVKEVGGATIAGERATCYEALPKETAPPPTTSPMPRFTPTKFRYELCYAKDGVLLRLKRTVVEPVPTGVSGTESILEATSVSRDVKKSEVELPGPVRSAADFAPER